MDQPLLNDQYLAVQFLKSETSKKIQFVMQHITLHQVVFSLITSTRIISKYSNKGWTVKLDIERT